MGLLSKLNGNKLIGKVAIRFYNENEASVEYQTKNPNIKDLEFDQLELFLNYYAKMLFNFNKCNSADVLIEYVQEVAKNSFDDEGNPLRENILGSENKLVDLRNSKVLKEYSGDLYERPNKMKFAETHFTLVGEGYYNPVSVTMFLQYLVKNLSDEVFRLLMFSLCGMTKYYTENGKYYEISGMIEAPQYGITFACEVLEELNKKNGH